MSEGVRQAWAAAAAAAWFGHAGWVAWRARQRIVPAGTGDIVVAYASQTGFAAYIAETTAAALREGGQAVALLPIGRVDMARLTSARAALFIAATTGEGDPPDDAAAFAARVMRATPRLTGLRTAVLALGDRNYTHFCRFGRLLDRWLADCGATRAADMIEVDAADPDAIRRWQQNMRLFGASARAPDWRSPAYRAGRLVSRTLLNAGSPGASVYHLAVAPEAGTDWVAGDIVEIYPGPAGAAIAGAPTLPHRDYSIASVSGDSAVELVVRQMRDPGGALGLGSRWLTRDAEIGGEIAYRIRRNPSFHAPAPDTPLILIGSGTGIAGLRALLKERPARSRNWLLFGERSAASDALFAADLFEWTGSGHLARMDRCFSRDGGGYVQDLLAANADTLRAWLADGAAVYVCGSANRVGVGVEKTLVGLLGGDVVESLSSRGLYRKDVY